MEKKITKCQSCIMPLKKDTNREHNIYCSNCWKDGKFTNPDMTIEEVKKNKLLYYDNKNAYA